MWVPIVIAYMIKKELDVYLRVPGSSDQNTDLDITLGPARTRKSYLRPILEFVFILDGFARLDIFSSA